MFAERNRREVDAIRLLLQESGVAVDTAPAPMTEADERILTAILAGEEPAGGVHVAATTPRRRLVVRVVAAATAVVAVAGAGIAWQAFREPAAAGVPPILHFSDADVATVLAGGGEPAHDVLTQLAAVAAAQPVTTGEGYQEITSWAWYQVINDEGTVLTPTRQRMVVGPDGSVINAESRDSSLDLDGHVIDGNEPQGGWEAVDHLPPGTADPTVGATLPRDPTALRAAILAPMGQAGCDASERATATCLVIQVAQYSTQAVIPSDLASALWTVLADEPTIVQLGATTDRLGRPGVAVGIPTGTDSVRGVYVLVISPEDGRLLEWDEISAESYVPGVEGPVLVGFQAFLSSRWIPEP